MKRWHWRSLAIAAVAWLVVTVVRAAMGVPGHLGMGGVLIAAAITTVLGIVAAVMFGYLWLMISVIWRERWEWLQRLLNRRSATAAPSSRTWHSNVDGPGHVLVMIIMEAGIYWFALLSGYGVLLGLYVMVSLAWTGNVALTTVQIG